MAMLLLTSGAPKSEKHRQSCEERSSHTHCRWVERSGPERAQGRAVSNVKCLSDPAVPRPRNNPHGTLSGLRGRKDAAGAMQHNLQRQRCPEFPLGAQLTACAAATKELAVTVRTQDPDAARKQRRARITNKTRLAARSVMIPSVCVFKWEMPMF